MGEILGISLAVYFVFALLILFFNKIKVSIISIILSIGMFLSALVFSYLGLMGVLYPMESYKNWGRGRSYFDYLDWFYKGDQWQVYLLGFMGIVGIYLSYIHFRKSLRIFKNQLKNKKNDT